MRWTTDPAIEHGVVDRGFALDLEDHVAPGVLLTPEAAEGPLPLVLVGHGRTLHKRHTAPYSVARRLARRDRLAVALLDQPGHGDRPPAEAAAPDEDRRHMALTDWTAALDALTALPEVDGERVGYWGLSLGTEYGLPLVAAQPRIGVAVLGLYGAPSNGTGDAALAAAAGISSSVLWVMQWDDELFDRDGRLALFDALGSEDKRMLVYPGGHDDTPDEGLRLAREFLVRGLAE
ncbi:MAG: alpha/beta hydrolase [Chloroflexi bacterium]|nr:alpha/beta hydrolase [Chloroflexota bacterium]MDA1145156.1 alpha/beta hydrolase [Chloroflexota bacterium]